MTAHLPQNSRHRRAPDNDAAFDAGLKARLTLLVAPAGSGKTASLRRWVEAKNLATAWYTCQTSDNRPEIFIGNLLAAVWPVICPKNNPPPEWQEPEEGLTELLNRLAAVREETVIVLDNYERIQAKETHAAVSFAIEYLPPQAHLYLAARLAPPLPVAHLRARRQLVELGPTDLL